MAGRKVWIVCRSVQDCLGIPVPPCHALPGVVIDEEPDPLDPGRKVAAIEYRRDPRWEHLDGLKLSGYLGGDYFIAANS